MFTLSQGKFFAECAVLDLEYLLLMSFGIVEDYSVAFLDGLSFKLRKLEIDFEELCVVIGRDDHAALFLGGD